MYDKPNNEKAASNFSHVCILILKHSKCSHIFSALQTTAECFTSEEHLQLMTFVAEISCSVKPIFRPGNYLAGCCNTVDCTNSVHWFLDSATQVGPISLPIYHSSSFPLECPKVHFVIHSAVCNPLWKDTSKLVMNITVVWLHCMAWLDCSVIPIFSVSAHDLTKMVYRHRTTFAVNSISKYQNTAASHIIANTNSALPHNRRFSNTWQHFR